MTLTPGERNSAVWHKLSLHFEERLKSLRTKNDNLALDATETAALRGRIAEIVALTALDKDLPEFTSE